MTRSNRLAEPLADEEMQEDREHDIRTGTGVCQESDRWIAWDVCPPAVGTETTRDPSTIVSDAADIPARG